MTRKELNLAIFEGTAEGVLWQPRLETWIQHHRKKGTLPERYKDLDDVGIYDALHCSVRYGYQVSNAQPLETYHQPDDIERTEEQDGRYHITTVTTPSGTIRTVEQDVYENGELVNRRIRDFPVKTVEGLQVLTDLVEREQFRANPTAFREVVEKAGHRGEISGGLGSSGFTDLIKWSTGLEHAYYL